MAGSATLGDNLVDDLVAVVDELREDLYAELGVRQYRVFAVKRTWSGDERNEGTYTYDFDTEITPLPRVMDATAHSAEPHGRDDQGTVQLTEISLTFTEDELTGGTLNANQEFYYRIEDTRGQGIDDRFFVPTEVPTPDREKNIGWSLRLRRAQIVEDPADETPVGP